MPYTINCNGRLLSTERPLVMGILNITRDSFFDGGRHYEEKDYIAHAERMLAEGADIIDIGCMSTRPGAETLPEAEELRVAAAAVRNLHPRFPEATLSIDTWRASVARAAVENGAAIINDISGGDFDAEMFQTVAALQVPYILMHTSGTPEVMQQRTQYDDVVKSVFRHLSERLERLRLLNVKDVIADVGFGFGKTVEQNYELLRNFGVFKSLGCPLLCALSRKSMLYKVTGDNPSDALEATVAAHTIALIQGADMLRAHDVKAARDAISIVKAAFPARQGTAGA
ncbi:MAG: dihydropteroate synthase [Bacteroidales bacterium]|nr:dihydropteroate synthase [Bacteroidales bacterium]